jgi:hypothetical protein
MRRFQAVKYRNDFAGLEYRVTAEDENEVRVLAEALPKDEATELVDAMTALDRKFNPAPNLEH